MSEFDNTAVITTEDQSRSRFYFWRIVITAGMGFFTDAYDLFIIGIVTTILAPIWHLSIGQLALLNAASLAAAAIGAVSFGALSDKFGRKKLYGLEVMILFFGAILSAVAPNFIWLFVARIIVGLGIGGDYPSSAIVASEHSTEHNRGYLVLLVFAMQAVGLIIGPMLASILIASGLSHDVVWRVLLGLGAIPAASVFYLRRRLQESKHFLRMKEEAAMVSAAVHELAEDDAAAIQQQGRPVAVSKKHRLRSKKWLLYLLGTAGSWFILDIAFYGNGISSVMIIKSLSPHANLLDHTLISALIFLVFAVPGYALAAKYVDRIGRKPLQILGFFMIAVAYACIAFIPSVTKIIPLFVMIFGISFFFVNFGPNTTTFLIPSEIYPTAIRARAHGISAAVGKCGAFIGAFFVPLLLKGKGLHFTMGAMAAISLVGISLTFLLPEMKKRALE